MTGKDLVLKIIEEGLMEAELFTKNPTKDKESIGLASQEDYYIPRQIDFEVILHELGFPKEFIIKEEKE